MQRVCECERRTQRMTGSAAAAQSGTGVPREELSPRRRSKHETEMCVNGRSCAAALTVTVSTVFAAVAVCDGIIHPQHTDPLPLRADPA